MIWLWTALALGADPTTATQPNVVAVTWAQPFQVAQAISYAMRADKPMVSEGWMLELTVPPGMALVRAIHSPVVYVGPWPARRANLSDDGTCMSLWVPGTVDLTSTPIYFGPPLLPENVTPELAAEASDQARAAGHIVESTVEAEPALSFRDEAQLMTALSKRCAAEPADVQDGPPRANANQTGPAPTE